MNDHTSAPNGSKLCLGCALCCDGSLYFNAHLHPDESEQAQMLGLTIFKSSDQLGFHQPCHLLNENACSIYELPERPQVCDKFRCKLLNRFTNAEIDLDSARNTVQTTRELLTEIQQLLPFGRETRVTYRGIRVMMAYVTTLPEDERKQYTALLEAVTQYIRFTIHEFISLKNETDDNPANIEMNAL